MKATYITTAIALMMTVFVHAQTGPKAKNAKPWKNKKTTIVVNPETKKIQGPKAKNQKPGTTQENALVINTNKKNTLQGPRRKNSRP